MDFYATPGARDARVAHAFYDAVLATMGWQFLFRCGEAAPGAPENSAFPLHCAP